MVKPTAKGIHTPNASGFIDICRNCIIIKGKWTGVYISFVIQKSKFFMASKKKWPAGSQTLPATIFDFVLHSEDICGGLNAT
ncbi:MAG TPA: hypothetical protein VE524_08075 [Nitrososphaeraceae archaeon]|nr:hypothetical protein [Nitrososphaeraceae archaeon]